MRVRVVPVLAWAAGDAARVREAAGFRAGAFAGGFASACVPSVWSAVVAAAAVELRVVDRAAGLRVVAGFRERVLAGSGDGVPSGRGSIVSTVSVTFGADSATTVDSTAASSDSSRLRSAGVRVVGRLVAGVARFAGVVAEPFGVEDEVRPELVRGAGDRRELAFFSGVSEDSVLSEGGRSKLTPLTYQDALRSARLRDEVQWFHTKSQYFSPRKLL